MAPTLRECFSRLRRLSASRDAGPSLEAGGVAPDEQALFSLPIPPSHPPRVGDPPYHYQARGVAKAITSATLPLPSASWKSRSSPSATPLPEGMPERSAANRR